jgi:hypothetical protein
MRFFTMLTQWFPNTNTMILQLAIVSKLCQHRIFTPLWKGAV